MAELLIAPLRRDLMCRAIDAISSRLNTLPLQAALVYDLTTVDASALAHLAQQAGVSELFAQAHSDTARRQLLRDAISLQKHRGTVSTLRDIIRRLGLGEITLLEGQRVPARNGTTTRNGWYTRGDPLTWANLRIVLQNHISQKQGALLRGLILQWLPARCNLLAIELTTAQAASHNAALYRNGTFNHGGV